MNLLVALDHRFERTPDGAVWSWFFDYAFWGRFLEVFGEIRVLARVRDMNDASAIARRSDGERVVFVPVPFYWGPAQYLRRSRAVRAAIRAAVRREDAILVRSGQIGNCLARILREDGHPYGMEVIGDPYDVFAPGASRHPLRRFWRWWYPRQVRRLCANAAAVSYVTAEALQKRYPPRADSYSTHYSSIELRDEALVAAPKTIRAPVRNLLAVGTMDQLYKGQVFLLRALADAVKRNPDLKLTVVGDGRHRAMLERLARELGVATRVDFLGQIASGAPVREQMDRADLFVLPSLQEGLPRALIEAMARAMPCVATTVGGMPELLPPEDRVPAGDADALAQKICEVAGDLSRLGRMSARNLEKARGYHWEILQERRRQFYRHLEEVTREWAAAGRQRSMNQRRPSKG